MLYYTILTDSPTTFMRAILTLSLPADLLAGLKKRAISAGMSVSAYVRRIVEHESHLITEDALLARWKRARKNYRAGKVHIFDAADNFHRNK